MQRRWVVSRRGDNLISRNVLVFVFAFVLFECLAVRNLAGNGVECSLMRSIQPSDSTTLHGPPDYLILPFSRMSWDLHLGVGSNLWSEQCCGLLLIVENDKRSVFIHWTFEVSVRIWVWASFRHTRSKLTSKLFPRSVPLALCSSGEMFSLIFVGSEVAYRGDWGSQCFCS